MSDPLQLLNPGETMTSEKYAQQVNGMNWKVQCLQPVQKKGPLLHNNTQTHATQPTLQKLNGLGCKVLPNPPCSPDFLPTNYHFFKQLFEGKTLPQTAENGFQEFIESWSTDFYPTGKKNLFLIDKNVLMVMVSLLINKDVFEPSYNDLKFTV